MQLEQRDKELAAIGASIGCNCRPCIEHHIPAGRESGLTEADLADAVATARAIRDEAIELLAPRVDELLGGDSVRCEPAPVAETSRPHVLVAMGASVGANSHPLLDRHIAAALELGLSPAEIAAATRMAGYVQKRASGMTADKAAHTLEELAGVAGGATAKSSPQNTQRLKETDMTRKYLDCREHPDDTGCTLYLSGEEDDVLQAVAEHAASVHRMQDTPELRERFRSMLKDEAAPSHA